MNKLEQEIEIEKELLVKHQLKQGFRHGVQFILDKNLAVEFAKWLSFHFDFHSTTHMYCYNKTAHFEYDQTYTIEEVYKFWEDNVYGK